MTIENNNDSGEEEKTESLEEKVARLEAEKASLQDQVADDDEDGGMSKLFLVLFVILSILVGAAGAYYYDSWERERSASQELQSITQNSGDITAINTDVLEYAGSDDSYALGVGGNGNYPDYGTLIFTNENQERKNTIVDLYIDYSSQRSVDLMLVNNTMLRSLVESGQIELRLHPVPSEHPLSMYAAETLAQVMHRHPDKVWEVNISLLQLHTELRDRGADETISTEEILELIENELSFYHDINDIDAELIREGMFFDWIASTAQSPRLSAGAPPLVYAGGNLLESDTYHNSEALRESILSSQSTSETDIEEEEEVTEGE